MRMMMRRKRRIRRMMELTVCLVSILKIRPCRAARRRSCRRARPRSWTPASWRRRTWRRRRSGRPPPSWPWPRCAPSPPSPASPQPPMNRGSTNERSCSVSVWRVFGASRAVRARLRGCVMTGSGLQHGPGTSGDDWSVFGKDVYHTLVWLPSAGLLNTHHCMLSHPSHTIKIKGICLPSSLKNDGSTLSHSNQKQKKLAGCAQVCSRVTAT
jgi:hypothetical protein